VVLDGRTGFVAPEVSPAAVAAGLERLLASAALRKAFGAAGRERVQRDFAAERSVETLVRAYYKLTEMG